MEGQEAEAANAVPETESGVPAATAARRVGPVEIDGRLDEEAWQRAEPATGFVQREPEEGADPPERTEVRILFDDEAIYVGARMYEADPDAIHDQLVRRDAEGQYDFIEIAFDPNLDRRTGFLFRVSAAGVQLDAFLFEDTRSDGDWEAVWESAVHRDSLGWTAEMRIPLSQLRFEAREGTQTWGFNARRRHLATNTLNDFSLISRLEEGTVSQFGLLTGIEVPDRVRRVELRPFALTELFTAPSDPANPLFDGSEFSPQLGLDASFGLGPAFSLDMTVNPDFGQVEVDPEVVNLTAFETFFPEKRPFFVQDAQIFDFGVTGRRSRLFFSRRIGRSPRGSAPDSADFSEAPGQTTILGAAKLTGRTQGGLSVGALAAVTDRETGRAYFADEDAVRDFAAEPRSQYGVVRVQQDFREGRTTVGGILTGMGRQQPDDGSFDNLSSDAWSAGLDFEHQWGGERDRDWALSGRFAGSLVRGTDEAMVRIQESANHFFQRPDAARFSVDSTASSLTGADWELEFARQSARHWTWSVSVNQVTPGFEINDLGFSNTTERVGVGGRVSFQDNEPGPLFRRWSFFMFTFHNWRNHLLDDFFSGGHWLDTYKGGGFFSRVTFEFHNNWTFQIGADYEPRALSDTETRGGPLMKTPDERAVQLGLTTDRRASVSFSPSLEYTERGLDAGQEFEAEIDMRIRPTPAWEISIAPAFRREIDGAQWVTNTDDVGFEPTFGRRHLFGRLDRRDFSLETRLNLTFTPDLSLEFFAQPLISAGDFSGFKQLARPATFEFDGFEEGRAESGSGGEVRCVGGQTCVVDGVRHVDFDGDGASDFTFTDPDFNIRSLRGNAVLRWEYRPGSTLFLVWQQDRRNDLSRGDFDFGRDVRGLFSAPGENTFILKVSHYLSP